MRIPALLPYGDRDLIALIQCRNKEAFSDLYDAFAPALYGIILQIVRDEINAAIVLERTLVCVWLHISEYDFTKQRLFTWIMHIALREALQP